MGRWFRRQDRDRKKGSEESEAPAPEGVPALKSGGAGSSPPEPEFPPEAAEEAAAGFEPGAATPGEAAEEPEAEAGEPRQGRLRRLRERLGRTREALAGGLDRLLKGRQQVDAQLLEDLEELLISADLGVETTLFLIRSLKEKLRRRELLEAARLQAALKAEMVALLATAPPPEIEARPRVVLLVGVNGVGKTTPSPSWPTGTCPRA